MYISRSPDGKFKPTTMILRYPAQLALAGGILAVALAVAGTQPQDDDDLAPLAAHGRTSIAILDRLRQHHLDKAKPLNDEVSSQILDKYLEFLDPKRVFFRADDIASFERHRVQLDDALRDGELEPAFEIYNVFRRRALQRVEYEMAVLQRGLNRFDFTIDETMQLNRREASWPETQEEAEEQWRLALKSRVLGGKLAGQELEDIGETLTKRAKNSLRLIRQTRSEDVFQLFINAFAQTYDRHTQYFSPRDSADFNIHMSLSLEGIGAVLGTEDEYTVVQRLVKGGPADLGGDLKATDRIVAVSQSDHEPFVDIVGWRTDEVVDLIRGPKGSPVLLKVMPAGPDIVETRVVTIVRDIVKLEEQAASKAILDVEHQGRQHRVGVVTVPTFYIDFKALRDGDPNYTSTTRDVARLIGELKAEGVDGLIVDLRNNGGGSLQEAVELAGLFVKSGPVVQVSNMRHRPDIYADTDEYAVWGGPLAVIVNGLSASASEIFAGAIQDYGLGIVVGSKTFGKGTVQSMISLQRGELKITERQFFRISGEGTERNGVVPDIAFPVPEGRFRDLTADIGAIATPERRLPPLEFHASNRVGPLIETLRVRHGERTATDPEFAYLEARKQRIEEVQERTHVSLREETRVAEKEADEALLLAIENALLEAKGDPPVTSIEELSDRREAETFDDEPSLHDDTLVRETANILVDFIDLSRPIVDVNRSARGRG